MKQIKCIGVCIIAFVFTITACMNGNEANSNEPVVTTPSASSSGNSSGSTASPAASNSFSVMDSTYNLDSIRTDTIRK